MARRLDWEKANNRVSGTTISANEINDSPRFISGKKRPIPADELCDTDPRYTNVTVVIKKSKIIDRTKKKTVKHSESDTPAVLQIKDAQRRKSKEKQEQTKQYWQTYDQEEKSRRAIEGGQRRQAEYVQYGKFIRSIRVHTADRLDIGMLSSGWIKFAPILKAKLTNAGRAGVTRANDIARMWNEAGFKTGSGKTWTPRLVNIAKSEFGIKHGYRILKQLPPV